jgi:TetR/AcrR family transcriptional regulator, cholesterol catabolism regulator
MSGHVRDQILQHCRILFSTKGVKSVTMDEIASSVGMSKKTIYSIFTDKEHIISTLMEERISKETEALNKVTREADNVVHELISTMQRTLDFYMEANPKTLYDIKKYHQKCWEKYLIFRESTLLGIYQDNLARGIKDGLYKNIFHPYIMSRLWLEEVEVIRNRVAFPNYRFDNEQLKRNLQYHFLFGLVTPVGQKLMKKHLQLA